MYRKIVWCYIIILTLLDISLNTKLTAQGKSHGAGIGLSVHESLVEGVTFQEWGKEPLGAAGGGGGGSAGGSAGVSLSPPALAFGRRALGAAHALTVTLTNTANTTLHLASVGGTSPDFHASFFDSKIVPPDGNTTFSVVYLGRSQGLVSAHLYIQTARGVQKYPVTAEGVPSEWGVWPILGLRVPANATLEPLLTLRNPTDQPMQVSEVYSSGGWLRLSLPDGGATAARAAWLLPPHSSRAVVRLRVSLPPHSSPQHAPHAPLAAYVRIKTNLTGSDLVIAVEARPAPPGEYVDPVDISLRARGDRDPPDTFSISVGSSAEDATRLEAGVETARCVPHTHAHTHSHHGDHHTQDARGHHTHNGVKYEGVSVSVSRPQLAPRQELTRAAELTLDYEKLWESYTHGPGVSDAGNGDSANGSGGGGGGGGGRGRRHAYCSGVVRLGRALLPYSLRLLPGTLLLTPPHLHFVTAEGEGEEAGEGGTRSIELSARNEFQETIYLSHIEIPEELQPLISVWGWSPRALAPARSASLATVTLLRSDTNLTLDSQILLYTNISEYTVPLRVYSGKLILEWEWPNSADGTLRLGALGTSSTRRVAARLRNPAPRALCVTAARAHLPGAMFQLEGGGGGADSRCIPAGGAARGVLTVVAPARAGTLAGHVALRTEHAGTRAPVALSAHAGRLHALPVQLPHAAPYAWARAPLQVESTMALRMRVLEVVPAEGGAHPHPALAWERGEGGAGGGEGEVAAGRTAAGELVYRPERHCAPDCYTGLDPHSTEGASWLSSGAQWAAGDAQAHEAARRADRDLLNQRRALYHHVTTNISLLLHTSQVVSIPVTGWARDVWPRLVGGGGGGGETGGAGWAGLAGVGGAAPLLLRVRNPSHSHPILLQPVLGAPPDRPVPDVWEGAECSVCSSEECEYSLEAFRLEEWRAVRGEAAVWQGAGEGGADPPRALRPLRVGAGGEVELKISFAPARAHALTAWLYLRNNLTIVEGVQLAGRGAYPSLELGGRRPGAAAPLLFEVSECGAEGVVRRSVVARNTGQVALAVRGWAVGGAACAGRGFLLAPCAPLTLRPNQSAPLTLSYSSDYTLARVHATLQVRSDSARSSLVFRLHAFTPPRLLARCMQQAPPPPWDGAFRAAGVLLGVATLVLVLAAAGLDAERLLRRARAARPPLERAPLDLRALSSAPSTPAPPLPAPRAPPPRRRKPRKTDPAAESRAFERWRASLRRDSTQDLEDEHSRSSSDERVPPPAPLSPPPEQRASSGDEEPHTSESDSSPPSPDDDESPDSAHINERPRTPSPPPSEPPASTESPPPDTARSTRRREDLRRLDPPRSARTNKHHTRKDKPNKRRERTLPVTPPRVSPPPRSTAVRWGASWSSVVARTAPPTPPAPLAPIGSDIRRPSPDTPPRAADNSLFYFNGEATHAPAPLRPEPEYGWRAPQHTHTHAQPTQTHNERPFSTPTRDFLDEPVGVGVGVSVGGVGGPTGAAYGSIGPVWGSSLEARAPGAAWPAAPSSWPPPPAPPTRAPHPHPHPAPVYTHTHTRPNNTATASAQGGAVRPPPGFGSSPPVGAIGTPPGGVGAVGARGVRTFDPFHSLAAIWSRDWRADDHDDR